MRVEQGDRWTFDRRGWLEMMLWLGVALPFAPLFVGCGDDADRSPTDRSPASPDQPGAESVPTGEPAADPAAGGDRLVTEVPAMAGLVQALQYTHRSEKPDQRCANCQLYTPERDDRGRCQLFAQGLVEAQGWCTSWLQRAAGATSGG